MALHQLGPPFAQFPGCRAIAKTDPHAGHQMPATTSDAAPKPVKWEQGEPGRALRIQTASGLQFAQKELRAKAAERLSLTFENPRSISPRPRSPASILMSARSQAHWMLRRGVLIVE